MRVPATPRVAITLAPGERGALLQLARHRGEPPSTTAGRLVRAALLDHGAQLGTPPARRSGPASAHAAARRAAPTAPAGAIDTLRARYPAELRHAPADPSADPLVLDALTALACWRADLDAAGDGANPHEILAFCHELRTFATVLRDRARRAR